MKFVIVLLVLSGLTSCTIYPFTVQRERAEERYESGEIKSIQSKKISRYQSNDFLSFYQRTRYQKLEFYPDRVIKLKHRKVTRVGEGGGACKDQIEIIREYDPAGKLIKETIIRCDGKKKISRFFGSDGRIYLKTTDRRLL